MNIFFTQILMRNMLKIVKSFIFKETFYTNRFLFYFKSTRKKSNNSYLTLLEKKKILFKANIRVDILF